MLSLEEDMKHKMDEKYRKMKENRISELKRLKDEYSALKNEKYPEYLNLCKTSLKLKEIPEELKINLEVCDFNLFTFMKVLLHIKKNLEVLNWA